MEYPICLKESLKLRISSSMGAPWKCARPRRGSVPGPGVELCQAQVWKCARPRRGSVPGPGPQASRGSVPRRGSVPGPGVEV